MVFFFYIHLFSISLLFPFPLLNMPLFLFLNTPPALQSSKFTKVLTIVGTLVGIIDLLKYLVSNNKSVINFKISPASLVVCRKLAEPCTMRANALRYGAEARKHGFFAIIFQQKISRRARRRAPTAGSENRWFLKIIRLGDFKIITLSIIMPALHFIYKLSFFLHLFSHRYKVYKEAKNEEHCVG